MTKLTPAQAEDYVQLCDDITQAMQALDITATTLREGLAEIVARLDAMRTALNEWHDVDISEAGYIEKIDKFMAKSSADDDFAYRVRSMLLRMGAIDATAHRQYMIVMLGAFLGVDPSPVAGIKGTTT